jgi:hypothetical protein
MKSALIRAMSLAALLCSIVLPWGAASAADLPAYRLDASLDPQARTVAVEATITLPDSLAGRTVEFLLAAPLVIETSQPAATRIAAGEGPGFIGINGSSASLAREGRAARWRVALPAGSNVIRLRYRGPVAFGFDTPQQEYARGFSETAGTIQPEGVYLAGSTLWYPYLGDSLFTFEVAARAPAGWHLIGPGNGSSRDADGVAHWRSELPIDELHLVGGPLVRYARSTGAVEAEVYLRKPDDALAGKYLEATARYTEMYRRLIGPYPYGKFALVENFWETGYGMPSFTLLGPQIIRFPFILTSSYPHEILHNWWGNSVYVDYASGNWCEGLTAYLADHLFKEQQGQGAEYRRDTLKKYRDFVRDGQDFPLTQFRSRHSPATEAVGYGKALMLFHMVRRQVGDDAFRAGLQRFYREFKGRRASFDDFRRSVEAASKQDLNPLFRAFVDRAGAPDLRLADVRVERDGAGYRVRGRIEQRQPGEPYVLDVPLALRAADGSVLRSVRIAERRTDFVLESATPPQLVELDPEFDLFRLLDARETAPSIGQLFGEPQVLAVLPAGASPARLDAYRKMLEFWSGGTQRFTIRTDREVDALPADRAVWVVGRDNALARRWFGDDAAIGLAVDGEAIATGTGRIPFAGSSAVVVRRHPRNVGKAIGWITVDPLEAAPGLARKLPHYGKYSYLGFEGSEPANTVKGEWPTSDSPLRADLRAPAERTAPAAAAAHPKRSALAELPAVFDPAALRAHVEWLAAPEREGRGVGSAGLEAAADYIAALFAKAGLEPGGSAGWFQPFGVDVGSRGKPRTARNVIGVLPGTDPAFAGQSVIVSAHYDHLGRDGRGVRVAELGQVHPGADDNASGVAVLLELARAIAAQGRPPRTIVFAAFSGEEEGLQGSRYFVAHPPEGLGLAGMRAVLNLDTVGRLGAGELNVLATGTASEWVHVFRGVSFTTGVPIRSIAGAAESSDQLSFIEKGIPGVQLFTQAHLDYHRPSDTANKVDIDGLVKVALVSQETLGYLVQRPGPLTATIAAGATAAAAASGPRPGDATRRVSFGIVPDYAEGLGGVRAESVVPDSPAARAGIRGGDVVTHLDGRAVASLGAFSEALKALTPGQVVIARVRRDGSERELRVTLTER